MHKPIELIPYSESFRSAFLATSVEDLQKPYVSSSQYMLAARCAEVSLHLVLHQGVCVGGFLLDSVFGQSHSFSPDGYVGLRSFFIDRKFQGKGIAKEVLSALSKYVLECDKYVSGLCLTVNCRNHRAYQLYQQAGFVDTQQRYLDGPAGPQRVMKMSFVEDGDKMRDVDLEGDAHEGQSAQQGV